MPVAPGAFNPLLEKVRELESRLRGVNSDPLNEVNRVEIEELKARAGGLLQEVDALANSVPAGAAAGTEALMADAAQELMAAKDLLDGVAVGADGDAEKVRLAALSTRLHRLADDVSNSAGRAGN